VSARLAWFTPLSRYVLEINPIICAVAIGGYVFAGALQQRPPSIDLVISALAPASYSGEEVTAMVQTTHAAALAAAKERAAAEQRQTAAETAPAATEPKRKPLAAFAKPAGRLKPAGQPLVPQASETVVAAAVPPSAPISILPEAATEARTWYGRGWDAVSGLTGAVARTTRLEDAAGLAAATPGAVARVGKRAVGFIADTFLPGSR
jgi:hypothetical protein